MGPYINNGNYRYGITEYDQPMIPQYNSTLHHKKCAIRQFPNDAIRDDGIPYKPYIEDTVYCTKCNKCNKINRNSLITNLVNIQSSINKVLKITLYGTTEKLDKTIQMKIGNKYCISYLTENGIQTVTGRLREISTNVPDECTTYIGNFSTVTTSAYIGLDCSSDSSSDKRLIYIASIRFIEELFDDNEDPYADLNQEEKLRLMLSNIDSTLNNIDEYIKDNTESSTDTTSDNQTDQCMMSPPPPPPYIGTPIIVNARPIIPPPYHPIYHPQKPNNNTEPNKLITDDLIEALKETRQMLSSFISEYEIDKLKFNKNNNNKCECCNKDDTSDNTENSCKCECCNKDDTSDNTENNCDCECCHKEDTTDTSNGCECDIGVPIVSDVPYNANDKDLYIVEDQ